MKGARGVERCGTGRSDHTVMVEGNHYFPADSVHWQYFTSSG